MAASSGNIDFVVPEVDAKVPSCPHGPALLFRKYVKGGNNGRDFFACSAFRDRKQCRFFRWADEKTAKLSESPASFQPLEFSQEELLKRFEEFWQQGEGPRSFCATCGLLLLPDEADSHQGHRVVSPVTRAMLSRPSTLFPALEDNKTFAQYLFSKQAVDFVLNLLKTKKITHVLCIGLPRVHEALTEVNSGKSTTGTKSLLLDLDQRYMQVYPPHSFCHYNMFNHHFFEGPGGQTVFEEFLAGAGATAGKSAKMAVLMDPPFGGMVEPLALTLEKIQEAWGKLAKAPDRNKDAADRLPVLWFFPYFMEARVTSSSPGLRMLDYKVDYDNHPLFHGSKSSKKKGSPVRIFTNLPASSVVLPAEAGYWFCAACKHYSSKENKHCSQCNSCTSKDGSTYVHCQQCGTCVKPSWTHCLTCGRCDHQDHQCGRKANGCHICGKEGHKRRECPEAKVNSSRKRKSDGQRATGMTLKKKRKSNK